MNKLYISFVGLLLWAMPAQGEAQAPAATEPTCAALLQTIEMNNTSLQALRGQMQAEVAAERTSLRLADPEAEVGYLFGSPKGIPNRINASVKQSLDWGVLSGRRKRVASAQAALAEARYAAALAEVRKEARRQLTGVAYANRLCEQLQARLSLAKDLQRLYQQQFDDGALTRVDLNKVLLNATMTASALRRAEAARESALQALQRINGGKRLNYDATSFPFVTLPDAEQLAAAVQTQHPQVERWQQAVELGEQQVRLAKSMAWPELSVGYAGEYVKGTNYSGVTLGVALPLWGNRRAAVRSAEAQIAMNRLDLVDVQTQLRADVQREWASAQALQLTAAELRDALLTTNNDVYLRKALDEGAITLPNYLLELSFYYEAQTALLEAERDAALACAALWSMLP